MYSLLFIRVVLQWQLLFFGIVNQSSLVLSIALLFPCINDNRLSLILYIHYTVTSIWSCGCYRQFVIYIRVKKSDCQYQWRLIDNTNEEQLSLSYHHSVEIYSHACIYIICVVKQLNPQCHLTVTLCTILGLLSWAAIGPH